MSREHRGTGNVYQPTYKDKQTGDVRTAAVWWVRWGYRGRILRQSSHSPNRSDAVKLLKRKLGEVGRCRVYSRRWSAPTGPLPDAPQRLPRE